jgi:hypothetical protein
MKRASRIKSEKEKYKYQGGIPLEGQGRKT